MSSSSPPRSGNSSSASLPVGVSFPVPVSVSSFSGSSSLSDVSSGVVVRGGGVVVVGRFVLQTEYEGEPA